MHGFIRKMLEENFGVGSNVALAYQRNLLSRESVGSLLLHLRPLFEEHVEPCEYPLFESIPRVLSTVRRFFNTSPMLAVPVARGQRHGDLID